MFVNALDPYYLGVTAIITVGWQCIGFAIAYGLQVSRPAQACSCDAPELHSRSSSHSQIDTITDFWSAANFFALAIITLTFGNEYQARNIIATIFVCLWAIRLGAFQLFRLLKMGSDTRFDEMRSKPLSFAQFWIAQALWVWTVSLPLTILNSPAVSRTAPGWGGAHVDFGTAKDIVGVVLWAWGLYWETAADIQKVSWR